MKDDATSSSRLALIAALMLRSKTATEAEKSLAASVLRQALRKPKPPK
jgi:hypothetical protein